MTTTLTPALTYEPHYTIAYPCTPSAGSSNPPAWTQWTQAQERTLANDYPFDVHATDPEDYINRCYLQWLWLPESIMPLKLFVPSLRHIQIPGPSQSTSETPNVHPVHAMIAPILRTTRTTSSKYHSDLLRVLNGGFNEDADMEESMMWFAVGYEPHASSKGKEKDDMEDDDAPWKDEAWRDNYLQKMERREALIQILLYMYKFSLPGPVPVDPSSSPPKKRKRSPSRGRKNSRKWSPSRVQEEEVLTAEDHLESFMDKLSMWQLMGGLDRSGSEQANHSSGGFFSSTTTAGRKGDKPRDWAQTFAEDIVEKEFKDKLPEFCALLRSKVFPMSVFSDDELTEPELNAPKAAKKAPTQPLARKPSMNAQKPAINGYPRSLSRAPSPASLAPSRPVSRAPSRSRFPSPLPIDNDVQMADGTSSQLATKSNPTNKAGRSRSLSLSQSLAQEQMDRERGTTLHAPSNARKRAVLTREVSMSRSFKRKASGAFGESQGDGITAVKSGSKEKEEALAREKEKEKKKRELERGVTLVEETPIKKPRLEAARPEREQSAGILKPLKALDLSAALPRPTGASRSQQPAPVQSTSRLPSKSKSSSSPKSPSPSPPHSPSPPPRTSRSRDISPDIFLPLPPSSPPTNHGSSQPSSQPLTHDIFSGNESPLTDFEESSSEDEAPPPLPTAVNRTLDRVKTKSFKGKAAAGQDDDDDDDEWTIHSSPDISLLNPKTGKSTKITNLKLVGPRPSPLKGKSTTAGDAMDVDQDDSGGDEDEVETQLAGDTTLTEAEFSEESVKAPRGKGKKTAAKEPVAKKPRKKAMKAKSDKAAAAAATDVEEVGKRTPTLKIRLGASQGTTAVLKPTASPSSMRMEVVITSPVKPSAKRGKKK